MTVTTTTPRPAPRRPVAIALAVAVALAAVLVATVLATLVAGPASAGTVVPDPVGVWPLSPVPEVVTGFDPPSSPWGAGHRGVDLLGHVGQTVRTALPGSVSFAGSIAGRGVVVVDHGATRTTYEPVDATVTVGERVAAGDPVGRLQAGASHCPPRACLHWGWLSGPDYLDPLRLVGLGPVRLLPLWRDTPVGAAAGAVAPPVPLPAYAAWRPLLDLLLGGGLPAPG
ncbi:MAG: peptidoglycan DD-metalloendopeptidase family protein [Oryzihumus sp.]